VGKLSVPEKNTKKKKRWENQGPSVIRRDSMKTRKKGMLSMDPEGGDKGTEIRRRRRFNQ